MKLRTKMVVLAAGLTLLGLASGLGITYWSLVQFRLADLDADNRLLARVILEATLTVPRFEVPEVVESYLVRESGVSAAQVYLNGRLLWEGGIFEAPHPLDPEGLLAASGTRTVGTWRVHTLVQDELTVQVGRRLTALQATLRPYAWISLLLLVVLSLLSGVLAWVVARFALRPLQTLTEATQGFEQGGELPPIPGRDEAATLASSFAALLERLKSERTREQRFLAYAAHELRTPISALRANLEAARLRGTPLGPEGLARLHREALRLETFAQNLLALSRAEAGEVRAEDLDLADLAALAYDRFQPLALEGGKELRLEADPAPVRADPRLLEQALNNLVANALRHTPKGEITLGSGLGPGEAFLMVADQGPGIQGEPREGLGLRVVRSVTSAHGGRFELDGSQGTQACLYLPLPETTLEPKKSGTHPG